MGKTSIMPDLVTVKATRVAAPPTWALLERQLISLMEKGARMMSGKYAERSGAWYWSDDLDDYYERSHNWCLLYNMGGDESLVDLALKHWNATTRLFDDRDNNRANNMDYVHGITPKRLKHNIHNEYFSIAHPEDAEWHHMGEGNMGFYDLALGDPTVSENARRARRFADMYLGEDPEAPIWDPEHKIIRSPGSTWSRATCTAVTPHRPIGSPWRWAGAPLCIPLSRSSSWVGGMIRSGRMRSSDCSTMLPLMAIVLRI